MEKNATQYFFNKIIMHVELLKQIIFDHDTRWRDNFWNELCGLLGFRQALTTIYNLRMDGPPKILSQTIGVTICALFNHDRNSGTHPLLYPVLECGNTPHTVLEFACDNIAPFSIFISVIPICSALL
jgi:hypothetical protein